MSELSVGQLKGLTVNSNKINVPSGHTLYAPGHVIQTVSATTTTEVSSTSSTLTDTTLTATITPKSTNSRILVIITHNGIFKSNANGDSSLLIDLYRGTTSLQRFNNLNIWTGSGFQITSSTAHQYLDSPVTTSAVTYKTMFANYSNVAEVRVQHRNAPSVITLMEIAA